MGNFVVFEGICCSGKTTICRMIGERLSELESHVVYNHGAMTYTELGEEFKTLTAKKDVSITTLYYFVDLMINTKNFIVPQLAVPNTVILQDRYYDALTTYIKAYGEYNGIDCDIYRIPYLLLQNNLLVQPTVRVFCIPPYEIIIERIEKSKTTNVHDYYKQNPKFLKMVYDELRIKANSDIEAVIIDTSSVISIHDGIEKVISSISNS